MEFHVNLTERSVFRKKNDGNMELHAYERMAQSAAWMGEPDMDGDHCENALLPQPQTAFPAETPVGMAYVPFQKWQEPYAAEEALSRGTMFAELDLPFMEGGCQA